MTDFPPEPWYLGGKLLVSAFLVPLNEIPEHFTDLPGRRLPLRIGDRTVVGVAFASYAPGGVLAYDELLVALPSMGATPVVTIPQIWVDSLVSMAGGRALWSIPKHMGTFHRTEAANNSTISMSQDAGEVARLSFRYGRTLLPGMRQFPLPTLQRLEGRTVLATNRIIGRVRRLRTNWNFAIDGPLSYLNGRNAFSSLAVKDASIIFGAKVRRGRRILS